MRRIALIGIGVLVLLVAGVLGTAALIPADHTAARVADYAQPPEAVWRAITENGTVTNLFFRFMSRFVFGYTATIETYLVDLGTKFGEETTPQPAGG